MATYITPGLHTKHKSMTIDSLKDKRIFVFDDNANNVFVMLKLLQYNGAHPIVAWFFKGEAHRMEESLPLDLILLDLMLPGGRTGFEVFEEIKSIPELADVPVVAVSAADISTYMPKTQEMGFDGYISKPIDRSTFPKQLIAVLNGEKVWHGE